MYKLNVISHFSAAHKLVGYEGACKDLHGHNWKVRIGILCDKTDDLGLTIDFKIVKKHLNELIDRFDHKYLNDLSCFKEKNPTSENIARFFYKEMNKKFAKKDCQISEVEIWESDNTSMVYFE